MVSPHSEFSSPFIYPKTKLVPPRLWKSYGPTTALYDVPSIGFLHLTPGNLAKSRSAEHSVNPCSTASAARSASGTRFRPNPAACNIFARIGGCLSVGSGIQTFGN